MRVVVIEDEQPSLDLLERLIRKNGRLELAGAYTDPRKALEEIPCLHADAVFLDVEMPGMSGLTLARVIRGKQPDISIVFVTAYEKYALDAFRVNAVNYLLKPMSEEDLNDTVDRLMRDASRGKAPPAEKRNRIAVLGGFEVYGRTVGQTVRWPTAKTRELFACFVLSRDEELDKWLLCERLWPRFAPLNAEHSLHSTVSRMKSALRAAGFEASLSCTKGRYRMDLSRCTCDEWELSAFLTNGPPVNRESLAEYEKILPLYKGDLFGAEDYPWCLGTREKLRFLYQTGLKDVGRYHLKREDPRRAIPPLHTAFTADPLDEEAASLLLRALFHMSDREKMVKCYTKLRRSLADELGVAPKASTARLYADLMKQI